VLNASGYVTARRRATVSSKVTGKVVEVLFEEGMTVTEGQVLARLDDSLARTGHSLAQAQLAAARSAVGDTEARLRLARRTEERARRLVGEGVAGQADLDAAEAEADSLEARLALAREEVVVAERQVALRRIEVDDTVIRAPFTGVAISKDAQPGEMISPVSAGGGFTRTGVCTLVDMGSLEIEVDVGEAYIKRVEPGQRVTAVLDAHPDWQIPSHVITTIPSADRQKATVKVRIAFEALDPRILPDMGVKVAFLGAAPAEGTPTKRVLVPRAALRRDGERDVVLVLAGDRLERRAVDAASRTGDPVEIRSGLRDGEEVVIEGPADLADGQRVRAER
jgi:RND family efflux transporter MFP subunit